MTEQSNKPVMIIGGGPDSAHGARIIAAITEAAKHVPQAHPEKLMVVDDGQYPGHCVGHGHSPLPELALPVNSTDYVTAIPGERYPGCQGPAPQYGSLRGPEERIPYNDKHCIFVPPPARRLQQAAKELFVSEDLGFCEQLNACIDLSSAHAYLWERLSKVLLADLRSQVGDYYRLLLCCLPEFQHSQAKTPNTLAYLACLNAVDGMAEKRVIKLPSGNYAGASLKRDSEGYTARFHRLNLDYPRHLLVAACAVAEAARATYVAKVWRNPEYKEQTT